MLLSGSAQTQIPRMVTTQLVLGLGPGPGDLGGGEVEVVADERVPGEVVLGDDAGLAERPSRLRGWLATGTSRFDTTRLTAEPFETCLPDGGFVEITSFIGTDADGV